MNRRDDGFSLVEVLIAAALTLIVITSVFALASPAQQAAAVEPEALDMQQRGRVGSDVLFADLSLAGAGLDAGPAVGPLDAYFAPVLPRRAGWQSADPVAIARSDAITIFAVPSTRVQTTLASAMAASSAPTLDVVSSPGCPIGRPVCGLATGDAVVVFDAVGHFDAFDVTNVSPASAVLQHHALGASYPYPAGATAAAVVTHVYYFDAVDHQLRLYDGYQTDTPVIDNVVSVSFSYDGDPQPPSQPKPPLGVSNCLYDASGNAQPMPTLAAAGGSLAPLPLSMLSDGPWCGSGSSQFDADLLRVRRVRATVRVQTSSAFLRGSPVQFFASPGTSRGGALWLPDYTLTFDVTPRNMNPGR